MGGRRPATEVFGAHLARDIVTVDGKEQVVLLGDLYELLLWGNCIPPSPLVVRTSVTASGGGFHPEFRLAEEKEYTHRLEFGSRAAVVTTPLVRWRVGEQASLVSPAKLEKLMENALRSLDRAVGLRPETLTPRSYRRTYGGPGSSGSGSPISGSPTSRRGKPGRW